MKATKLFAFLLLAFKTIAGLSSCSDDDDDKLVSGVLSLSMKLEDGTGVDFYVDQTSNSIDNRYSQLGKYISDEEWAQMEVVSINKTINTSIQYKGVEVMTGTIVDFSNEVTFTAINGTNVKAYTLKVLVSEEESTNAQGVLITSDMTAGGLPAFLDFDVAYFNDKFYMIGFTTPTDSTSKYEIYSSENARSWSKVETNIKSVGGLGAKLVAYNNKLYVIGGTKSWGTDEEGNEQEIMNNWGVVGPYIQARRIWSSTDGSTWDVVENNIYSSENRVHKFYDSNTIVFDNTLYSFNGFDYSYGMGQPKRNYRLSIDINGSIIDSVSINIPDQHLSSGLYSVDNKLFMAGGFKNFISATMGLSSIISSVDNGVTWEVETEESGIPAMWGQKVVSGNGLLYMIGGEYFDESGSKTLSNVIYSSEDGINWTALSEDKAMPETYQGRQSVSVVVVKGDAYIFGGRKLTTNTYGGKTINEEMLYDVWVRTIR